jgi:hypothetical protein
MDNSRLIETNCDTACASETEQGGRKRRRERGARGGKASGKPQARRRQPTSKPTTNDPATTGPEAERSRAAEPHTKSAKKNTKSFNGLKKTKYLSSRKNVNF